MIWYDSVGSGAIRSDSVRVCVSECDTVQPIVIWCGSVYIHVHEERLALMSILLKIS